VCVCVFRKKLNKVRQASKRVSRGMEMGGWWGVSITGKGVGVQEFSMDSVGLPIEIEK